MELKEKLELLKEIQNNYDAYYIENKYGDGTHKKEFDLLHELVNNDEMCLKALGWIKNRYDCYYSNEQDEKGPFAYLEKFIKEQSDGK